MTVVPLGVSEFRGRAKCLWDVTTPGSAHGMMYPAVLLKLGQGQECEVVVFLGGVYGKVLRYPVRSFRQEGLIWTFGRGWEEFNTAIRGRTPFRRPAACGRYRGGQLREELV